MKLRDRQKRASNDIKQEDKKAVINLINTPSSALNESNAYSFNIKQEDTKNDSSLLQQDDAFEEEKDYSYRCDICKKRMLDLKSVLKHRKATHEVRPSRNQTIKETNAEPEIHDPNFYCRSCKVIYKDRKTYRGHLRNIHFMILKKIPRGKPPLSTIVPDPDDPNHYCRACDRTYTQTSSYKQHCQYMHGMTSVKFGIARSKPDGITDSYCKICDVRLSSKRSYKCHLFAIHKIDWRLIYPNPENTPNIDDPNFYCCACEKKLANKYNFKNHLILIHSIYQSAPKKTNLKPDADDPNNNCCACEKKFSSRCRYRKHLRIEHQMVLPRLKNNANLGGLPNPKDPQYFCSVCKKSYKTLELYRIHCNNAHFLQLD
ncbi:hypothetical protein PS15m_012298 [Mucor circinelloides]